MQPAGSAADVRQGNCRHRQPCPVAAAPHLLLTATGKASMPTQILFIQGAGETTHDAWDNKLVDSLARELGPAYAIRYPAMPEEGDPRYGAWKAAVTAEFQSLEDGAILIGHSFGGTVLVHTLAEDWPAFEPGAVILIAPPYIGAGGWESGEIAGREDFSESLPEGLPVLIYHGSEDDTVPFAHIELYARAIPDAVVCSLPGRDHQLDNDLADIAKDIRALQA
jgi:predicted alpha/beta hydrolase family esterase